MILEVKYWPDPCLKKEALEVDPTDPGIPTIIANLFETMYARRGMGLAATQCDIQQRILVIDGTLAGGKIKQAFINPVIKEKTEKKIITEEGCLSFPGVYARVERYEGVIVESDTLTSGREDVILSGVDAVCFQHELDHLNGVVFFDHLGPAKRRLLEEKIRKNVKKINRRTK